MRRKKVLLFIGAGPEMVPGIQWAREMGLFVVATDMNPNAEGFRHADVAEIVSTRDVSATVEVASRVAQEHGLDGVMTLASDVPLTVAMVASELGLPGLSVQAAAACQDKLHMKEVLASRGVPIPRFKGVETLEEALHACKVIGYPIVIKPVDASAARGVSLVGGPERLPEAFAWAARHRFGRSTLLIEEYLPGPQVSSESVVIDGAIYTTGFADRNYELNSRFVPFFIEDGHTIPSELAASDQKALVAVAEQAIRALDIDFGVGKGDLVLTPQGPKVIEFAARLSGGRFSTDTVPLATGVNLVKAMIRLSLGERVDPEELKPRHQRAAAQRYLFPEPGVVTMIDGVERVVDESFVTRVEVYVSPGSVIPPVSNHTQRSGYVIAVADDRAEAVRRAEWARDQIRIVTAPRPAAT